MLPLGGLFLGIELIPLFPPLRAVMLKKQGGEAVSVNSSGLTGFWIPTWALLGYLDQDYPGLGMLLVFEFTQVP